jgi:hypothetical protein
MACTMATRADGAIRLAVGHEQKFSHVFSPTTV